MKKGRVMCSKADKAGHESPGEDCGLPHQTVSINDSQFGFVPGRGTTNAVIAVTRVYLATNKRFCMAFVDLEKAFDGVPRKIIRWALRKLGVDCVTGAGDVCQ